MTDNDLLRSLTIREFNAKDQSAARRIVLAGLGEHFSKLEPSLNPDLDDIDAAYLERGHRFFVAAVKDEIIGTGGILFESKSDARIVRMSVSPEFRGHGIGKAIVSHLVDFAQQSGIKRILIETNLDWYSAINLYKQCGFREQYSDDTSLHLLLEIEPHKGRPARHESGLPVND
jgi:GNAT superfamily N-acetyltransferase